MENSRHDRAIIMVSTYIIGFVSAYIAFGVEQLEQYIEVPAPVAQTISAPVTERVEVTAKPSSLVIDHRGLVLVTDEEEILLATRKSYAQTANVIAGTREATHKLIEAELSRDGMYAYFCEQVDESDEVCSAYVYSVKKDIMYPLQIDREIYTPNIDEHFSAWSAGGYLMVDGYSSVSSNTPWLLQ